MPPAFSKSARTAQAVTDIMGDALYDWLRGRRLNADELRDQIARLIDDGISDAVQDAISEYHPDGD